MKSGNWRTIVLGGGEEEGLIIDLYLRVWGSCHPHREGVPGNPLDPVCQTLSAHSVDGDQKRGDGDDRREYLFFSEDSCTGYFGAGWGGGGDTSIRRCSSMDLLRDLKEQNNG
jgi:hypothetical protein